MNQTLTRWLTCGACAVGSVGLLWGAPPPTPPAQEPAARLLPVRAVDPPTAAVVRAAPPSLGSQFQVPTSVPAPGVNRPPQAQYQPQPQYQAPPTQPPVPPQPSLWGGVKSMFGAKPGQPPTEQKPWWPIGEQQPPPVPPKPPQGVYAGTPAYRWYGYGSPTAGANPYALEGRYPQASDSWFTQTGATPGAFPVPVGGPPVTPRERPVVVQALPQEPPQTLGTYRPPIMRTASEQPDPAPTRVIMVETPRPTERREPVMPVGVGLPVPTDPNTPPPDVNWLPASTRVPIAATTDAAPAKPQPVLPTDPATDWGPSRRPLPTDAPLPTVSVTRGQAPAAGPVDVDEAVRSACYGRASRVGISRPGPQKLHVTLVVPTEADARDAAAVISRLPEVKAYAVTFEAVIGK